MGGVCLWIYKHKGLKIPRPLKPCRFDSGPGYIS